MTLLLIVSGSPETIMSSSEAKQTEERWTENGSCSQTLDLFFLQRKLYTLYLHYHMWVEAEASSRAGVVQMREGRTQ